MAADLNDRSIQLACPRCDALIDSEEVNVKLGVAKCTRCGTVFGFADQLAPRAHPARPAEPRPEVPLPPRIRVDQWGHELSLSWRWFTLPVLFLVFFCIAWDSFLVFWYGIALTTDAPWIMSVFPIAHVAVGLGLTYYTVASLFNTTRLRIAGGELKMQHGPIPWRGEVNLPASDIEQVFCTEKIHRGKHGHRSWTYRVNAMLTDGRRVELVSGLPEADEALYIEQTLELHLGIADRRVGGEMEH